MSRVYILQLKAEDLAEIYSILTQFWLKGEAAIALAQEEGDRAKAEAIARLADKMADLLDILASEINKNNADQIKEVRPLLVAPSTGSVN